MDPIKEAFHKVKSEFSLIKKEITDIKSEFSEIQLSLLNLTKLINSELTKAIKTKDRQTDRPPLPSTDTSTDNSTKITMKVLDLFKEEIILLRHQLNHLYNHQTEQTKNQTGEANNTTHLDTSTDTSTQIYPFKALKEQKTLFSIGNNGVSTDRQTDQQTDKNAPKNRLNASKVLNQLDDIKKELRSKVIQLTNQEMLVYSTIYQFEDQGHNIDYTLLSTSLGLSESSIRDYIQRIIFKGLPLTKEKEKNKKVILKIPSELRKLATLDTLLKLRDL